MSLKGHYLQVNCTSAGRGCTSGCFSKTIFMPKEGPPVTDSSSELSESSQSQSAAGGLLSRFFVKPDELSDEEEAEPPRPPSLCTGASLQFL